MHSLFTGYLYSIIIIITCTQWQTSIDNLTTALQ